MTASGVSDWFRDSYSTVRRAHRANMNGAHGAPYEILVKVTMW